MRTLHEDHLQSIAIRNFIFGVEDSLVSTVGLLSGIAVAGVAQRTILLTGIVLICVEAFSMAVGSFLSENSVGEATKDKTASSESRRGGLIMFFSYFLAGFIPLLPYIIASPGYQLASSIISSLIALFLLGVLSGKLFNIPILKNGIRMLALGGIAILAGVVIGRLLPQA